MQLIVETIFEAKQFSGVKYIHFVVRPSAPSFSRTFHLAELKSISIGCIVIVHVIVVAVVFCPLGNLPF